MQHMIYHCLAEICKTLSEKTIVWMGGCAALKPTFTFED